MTEVDNQVSNVTDTCSNFISKYKWWIVGGIGIVVIAVVIAVIIYAVMKNSSSDEGSGSGDATGASDGGGRETFVASDMYTEQFNYANSYIDSVLGGA